MPSETITFLKHISKKFHKVKRISIFFLYNLEKITDKKILSLLYKKWAGNIGCPQSQKNLLP